MFEWIVEPFPKPMGAGGVFEPLFAQAELEAAPGHFAEAGGHEGRVIAGFGSGVDSAESGKGSGAIARAQQPGRLAKGVGYGD
jgi:hypothetical protein